MNEMFSVFDNDMDKYTQIIELGKKMKDYLWNIKIIKPESMVVHQWLG